MLFSFASHLFIFIFLRTKMVLALESIWLLIFANIVSYKKTAPARRVSDSRRITRGTFEIHNSIIVLYLSS